MASPFETRVPSGMLNLEQDIYFPGVEALGLLASKVAQPVLTVDQDADLIIVGGARIVTDAATDQALQAFPNLLIAFRMTTSARDLMPTPVHIETLLGTAQAPAAWPRPKIIRAGSQMRVQLTNLSATNYNVRITFFAFKVFPR